MNRFLAGFTKLILGVLLAFFVISLAGVAAARYFLTRLADLPPQPIFDEEPADEVTPAPASPAAPAKPAADSFTTNDANVAAEAASEPEAAESPANVPEALPPGAHRSVVTQSIGLIMRAGPGAEYEQLGGVNGNEELVVLEEANGWAKVKTAAGQEGWVKGGANLQQLEETQPSAPPAVN